MRSTYQTQSFALRWCFRAARFELLLEALKSREVEQYLFQLLFLEEGVVSKGLVVRAHAAGVFNAGIIDLLQVAHHLLYVRFVLFGILRTGCVSYFYDLH